MAERLEVLRDLTSIAALAADWNRLADHAGHPLLRHEWILSCAEALHPERDLRVVVVESGGRVRAIAPLVVVERQGVRSLELIGAGALKEPSGLLYDHVSFLPSLATGMTALRMPVALRRVPAASGLTTALTASTRWRSITIRRPGIETVHVPTDGSWDEYHRSLSPQRRYDLRRARKRAGDAAIDVRIACPAPADVGAWFDLACEIEARSWKGHERSALRDRPAVREFFRRYLARTAELGTLRMAFLTIGGAPCAMQIAVQAYARLWILKIGYDEAWARCSPGMLLTEAALRFAFEQRLDAYEFLGFPEPWLAMWARGTQPHTSLLLYPLSARGTAAFVTDTLAFMAQRVRARRQEPHASAA
jgi:CelD/BcsL family acetyltransferase involved in cellulose biosynthesis